MRAKTIIPLLVVIVVFTAGFGYFFLVKNNEQTSTENTLNLLSQVDDQAGISFEVTPLDFSFDKPISFEIKIDTHTGSLDFDLTKISVLENEKGDQYKPLSWQGPGSGGHHLAGTLFFPKINNQTKTIKLTIQDAYLRVFKWEIK